MSSFPRKLFELLSREDASIVAWNKDGKSFHIRKVIPKIVCPTRRPADLSSYLI